MLRDGSPSLQPQPGMPQFPCPPCAEGILGTAQSLGQEACQDWGGLKLRGMLSTPIRQDALVESFHHRPQAEDPMSPQKTLAL